MDLYTKLSTCMEELSSTFEARMIQYEVDLKNAAGPDATHKNISSLSRDFAEFKSLIWRTMAMLKAQVELLLLGLDRHEMASRRKVVLLHGVREENEDVHPSWAVSLLSDKLKLPNMSTNDIESCHRLGSNTKKPRPLLIRFNSYRLRNEVWNSKTKLKGSGLTLSEFLTKPRHSVFMEARKHFGIRNCWTSDGKIVVQLPNNQRRKFECIVELRKLCLEYPASQLPPDEPTKSTSQKTTASIGERRSRKQAKGPVI